MMGVDKRELVRHETDRISRNYSQNDVRMLMLETLIEILDELKEIKEKIRMEDKPAKNKLEKQ